MNAYETEVSAIDATHDDDDNVIAFPVRNARQKRDEYEPACVNMERFPVDIRGEVTFGRLMSGLATVGLTVRVDTRSGRVIITDDEWE
jgi:hypothetical protein